MACYEDYCDREYVGSRGDRFAAEWMRVGIDFDFATLGRSGR